jgi:predicted Zn finger-like uncharacterized protein
MKFACMSCSAKYAVPDERVEGAGSAGLRIRCSRCRAIMVVSSSHASLAPDTDDDTKELRRPRAHRPSEVSAELLSSTEGAVPAQLSASGVFRPLPGVQREVTGFFLPELDELRGAHQRLFYAAIEGRPRGPFTAQELITLAERGKVRDSTAVWRPGFAGWTRVKNGKADTAEDLTWLREVVVARRMREQEVEAQRLAQVRGMPSVALVRTRSRRAAETPSTIPGMPPPLPEDADDGQGRSDDPRAGRDDPFLALAMGTATDGPSLSQMIEHGPRRLTTTVRPPRPTWPWMIASVVAGTIIGGVVLFELARSGLLSKAALALLSAG